ncbi:GTPase activating protein (GAP) for Rho1p [Coemansia aciculifera]|uniref:GTPase activating protein (GAP) for Rho1p n=1 Tax=Coemansia aciculifera TaxID=417176 RepID=A0A9W8M6R9_9FUNG|nr:GTPase activating protein (GAP) for Rho1p [Coemansia aciculifera]
MDVAEGRPDSGRRQRSPGGSMRSGSTSSHSSTNSERYHLASADVSPESEMHAYYTDGQPDAQLVSENIGSKAHLASPAVPQKGAFNPAHQHYGSTATTTVSPSFIARHIQPVNDGHQHSDVHSGLRRNVLPQPHQGLNAAPQTVTATMVDPSAITGKSSATRPYSGHASLTDGPARMHTRNFSSSNYDIEYSSRQSHQPPQPTLAALALADSRGHLDSGLGYYQPHRVRTDFGNVQGFRSEPASGAGSPTNRVSDSHLFSGREAISADNTVAINYSSRAPPSASALGVMFSAPMALRNSNNDSRGMDRDFSAATASEAKLRGMRHAGSTTSRSPAMSEVLHGGDKYAHHFQQHRSGFSSASSPQIPDGGRGFYSGDDSSQAGASRSQLSVLPENSSLKSFHDDRGSENNRHMAQSSTEFAPHASSSPSISAAAASLTAVSSFSFRNSQTQLASSHPLPSQSSYGSHSNNRHSTATATTATNRDSMFLRLKEKMKSFKPRSRPQSDNFADRRSAAGAPLHGVGSQPLPTSIMGSPSFNKVNRGNSTSSETQLFGMSLSSAVKVAGVHVGSVAESGEACVVPTVVAVCGRHLCDQGQQTQGIFRVNGSMKRVQLLQDEFCEQPLYGRQVEWSRYTLHDAATILRRYLISLPESVISAAHYNAFLDKLAESLSDSEKAHDYSLLIGQLTPESRHTLLYMLELLSVFARPDNCARTLMNASNLAAVLQPCLLVHPGHVANPHEYSKAKDVVEFLIAHASELHTTSSTGAVSRHIRTEQSDGPLQGGEGFLIVGQDVLSDSGDFGAGLIIAAKRDELNSDNDHTRGVASDDGTTLGTSANVVSNAGTEALASQSPAAAQLAQTQDRWSSAFTRDSGLTTVHSADSTIPTLPENAHSSGTGGKSLVVGSATYVANGSEPSNMTASNLPLQQTCSAAGSEMDVARPVLPPRDGSLATVNLNMSTPVMGTVVSSRAHTVRPLGSVTARLFDPTTEPQSSDAGSHQVATNLQQLRLADLSDEGDSSLSPDMPSAGSPFMGSFTSWPSNRSSMALSSVQYQYTRSPLTPQQLQPQSHVSIAQTGERSERDIGGSPRPRRSQSFAVPVKSSEEFPTALTVQARLEPKRSEEELRKDMMNRSSIALQARRGTTGERRAGCINVAPVSTDNAQPKPRPLPTIPVDNMARSATEVPLSQGLSSRFNPSVLPASKTMGAEPASSQNLLSSSSGAFHLYPQPQANRVASNTAKIATRSPMMQYNSHAHMSRQAPPESLAYATANQQAHAARNNAAHYGSRDPSAGRASWLSDEVPEEELEREFTSAAAMSIAAGSPASSSGMRVVGDSRIAVPAQQSVPYLMDRYSEAQQHKLHPIGRADPMPIMARQQQPAILSSEQGKHGKQQQKNAGSGDKAGMSRLKNIFRIKHSSSAEEPERSAIRDMAPVSSSDMSAGAWRHHYQGSAHSPSLTSRSEVESVSRPFHQTTSAASRAGGSTYGNSLGGGTSTPIGAAMQHSAGVSIRDHSVSNSFEAANRIQVAVPAGHLSIVYPDSPMSKTDTLRRASTDSLTRRANGGISSSRSGHAYLVDPDQELVEEAEMAEDSGLVDERHYSSRQNVEGGPSSSPAFRGANLHPAASNSTTLHSASYVQQQHKMYGGQQQRVVSGTLSSTSGMTSRHSSSRPAGAMDSSMRHESVRLESPLHQQWHNLNQQQQPFQPYHMRVHTPSALGAVQTAPSSTHGSGSNVFDRGSGSSDGRRLYAMHRLAGSETRVDGQVGDGAYVLPSISNGSPLLSGFEFGSGERSPPVSQQYTTMQGRGRRQSTRRSIVNDGDCDDSVDVTGSVASNSPRRSRSLRNTITSLRRKLSRSSRSGAAANAHSSSPDMSPTAMDDSMIAAAH